MAPHVLHMTATPIPRTLSLTAYGDLDTTALHELPAGRQPVETRLVEEDERAGAYEFLREQLREGRQAFVVCPLVEESEKLQGKAAEVEAERLARRRAARLPRSASCTARCPRPRRRRRWRAFAAGETDVLVATTVIEVGIDVANATVMVIEGAERYGVSQLHQLRGRVGRGEHASHCLLFAEDAGELARRRLRGGRARARRLQARRGRPRLRGEGEVLGTRQHGLPRFAVAELPEDTPTLVAAREEVLALLRRHGSLDAPGPRPAARRRPPPLRRRRRRPDSASDGAMRVIAGELEGQRLVAPRGWKVRPTSDRVREAIFSALGERSTAPASSTSTAAPARWRSRRSRAAPPARRPRRPRHPAGARQRRAARPRRARRAGPRRRRPLAGRRRRGPSGARFDLVFVDAPYRLADRVGQELDTHLPRLLAAGGRAIVESGAAQAAADRLAGAAAPAPLRRRRRLLLRGGGS